MTSARPESFSPPTEDLRIDRTYRNTSNWKDPADEFNRYFRFADGQGIKNVGGFRAKKAANGDSTICSCAFMVVVTTFSEPGWPDHLDLESGQFTYYGDNITKGGSITDTPVGGNRFLEHIFETMHAGRRSQVQPVLAFERIVGSGPSYMRFLGLACPGAPGMSSLDDLVSVWRISDGQRFANYRATFTILNEERIPRAWLDDLVSGVSPADSASCPPSWRRWVKTGAYAALECQTEKRPRSREEQLPATEAEWSVLRAVHGRLTDRQFEFAARDLVRLMDRRFTDLQVTRSVRDGGYDAFGSYRVGHAQHQVGLSVFVEAKHYHWETRSEDGEMRTAGSIGVKAMSRLLSRLKHRDIGVFVTTSVFDGTVQQELIDDRHPVILIGGGDIARLLVTKDIVGGRLDAWIEGIKSTSVEGGPTSP